MPRVIHFEIQCDDLGRAAEFYENVFGWTFQKWEGHDYWLVSTGEKEKPGIDGGFMTRDKRFDSVTNIVGVPDIDEYVKKLETAGAVVVAPKSEVGDFGYAAYYKDTEGNTFGIFQYRK
jgi:uncharacterized protein